MTANGIEYTDERPTDRDIDGVLWMRRDDAPGTGRPQYARVPPAGSGRPWTSCAARPALSPPTAPRTGCYGFWTTPADHGKAGPRGCSSPTPPVCLPCARLAVRLCPLLSTQGYTVVRVQSAEIVGVYGLLYPTAPGADPEEATVMFDDPAIRRVIAGQLVRALRHCTLVHLDDEPQ